MLANASSSLTIMAAGWALERSGRGVGEHVGAADFGAEKKRGQPWSPGEPTGRQYIYRESERRKGGIRQQQEAAAAGLLSPGSKVAASYGEV